MLNGGEDSCGGQGTAIITIPLFIKERFGKRGLNQWKDALTPEARKVYPASVLVSSWYPLKDFLIEPLRKMGGLFYARDLKGAKESGRFSADYSLKGIYKIFVKLGSPEFMLRRAGSILPIYYTPSEMEVVECRKGRGIMQITQFPDIDQGLEIRIGGWIERAIEISGDKQPNIKNTKSLIWREIPYRSSSPPGSSIPYSPIRDPHLLLHTPHSAFGTRLSPIHSFVSFTPNPELRTRNLNLFVDFPPVWV
jgi:hypothetical protein